MDKLFLSKLEDWLKMCMDGIEDIDRAVDLMKHMSYQMSEIKQILEAEQKIREYSDDSDIEVTVEYYEIPDYLH